MSKVLPITLNEYVLHDDYAEMVVVHSAKNTGEQTIVRVKVDLDDVDRLRSIPWFYNMQSGYIQTKKLGLQRFIMSTPKNKITDHINGDKFDNRKSNLRIVTPLQSQMNTNRIGVGYRKDTKKYRAYAAQNSKHISLGVYDTYEEACKAREQYEIENYGEFRRKDKFDFLR